MKTEIIVTSDDNEDIINKNNLPTLNRMNQNDKSKLINILQVEKKFNKLNIPNEVLLFLSALGKKL